MTEEERESVTQKNLKRLDGRTEIIAIKESDFGGLPGWVTDVKMGEDRETENECRADIYVEFDEIEGVSIEESHPDLVDFGLDMVIMAEDELAFRFDGEEMFVLIDGRDFCRSCLNGTDYIEHKDGRDVCPGCADSF